MTIRILVIDDHALVRAGVRAELESSGADFDIVGEASDVEGAIAACHALTPDVALLDVHREETVAAGPKLRPRALMLRGSVSLRSRCQIPQKTLFRLFVRALADTLPSRSRPLSLSRPFNVLPREMLPFRRAWPVLFWMLSEGQVPPLPLMTMNWICCQPGSRKSCV